MAATLYYFPAAGRAETARLIGAAGGIELLEGGNGSDLDKSEFGSPQGLPLLAHGDLKISQSGAIETYLSLLAFPDLPNPKRAVDTQFCCMKEDIIAGFAGVYFGPKKAEAPVELAKVMDKWFPVLESLLPNGGFVNGMPYPTAADLVVLTICEALMPFGAAIKHTKLDLSSKYPKMAALSARTAKVPEIQAYMVASATLKADPFGVGARTFGPTPSGCPFVDIIKATTPAVAPHVRDIIHDFYPRMFADSPAAKEFFNPANQFADPPKQRMALANAVVAYASNIDDLTPLAHPVEIIAHKHCGLTVLPEHYSIVQKNLLESVVHVLGDVVTPEIGQGWSDAVASLAKILYTREEQLYQMAVARRGGWRGIKDFTVGQKRLVSEKCMEFTFEPVDGSGPIDFTPGQFLTLHYRRKDATPRHYTVTNQPGQNFLQCCIKRVPGGLVSNSMHELAEGEIVGLAAPYGTFGMKDKDVVLISSGIGVTPMKSFLAAAPEKVKMAVHIDKNESAHPFKEEFASVPTFFHYTQAKGRPTAEFLVNGVLAPYLAGCDFMMCGPPEFLVAMKAALTSAGATGVYVDVFGPELAM